MIRLSQQETKDWLAIHGWSGVILGLLLYAVILTGTVAVFATEIGRWSSPLSEAAPHGIQPGLNAVFHDLYEQTDPRWREEADVFSMHGDRLFIRFEGERDVADAPDGHHEHYGVEYQLDPNNYAVLQRTEGTLDDIAHGRTAGALAEFFVDLHVRLHIPNPWGIFITGLLGVAMMVAAITGFVVHRHLIKEMFTIRREGRSLKTARDTHVIAGTWNLPFAFVLAFTGSFFSFASALGLPAMAMVVFQGDQERALEEVFGAAPATDDSPAPIADLDRIIVDIRERSGVNPSFLNLRFPGRADAYLRAFVPAAEGALSGRAFDYAGDNGEFIRENPILVGSEPSLGNDVAALMAPLHFGNFSGLLSKAVWFAMGFAGAYVTLTGMLLWMRRREEQPAWQRMRRVVVWVGYGLPTALAFTGWGFFSAGALDADVHRLQWQVFGASAAVAAGVVTLCPADRARRVLLGLTGVGLMLLPVVRMLSGGPAWGDAIALGHGIVVGLDLVLLFAGTLCLRAARSSGTAVHSVDISADEAQAEPVT